MTISDRTLQHLCIAAGLLLLAGFTYNLLTQEPGSKIQIAGQLMVVGLFFSNAYRLSARFKRNLAVKNLITLDDRTLSIRSCPQGVVSAMPVQSLAIERITQMAIGDRYLSVILDDNGNGYDFALADSKEVILKHIKRLLPEDCLSRIAIELV